MLGDQNTRVLILLDGHALNSPAEVGSSKVGEAFGIAMDQVERLEIIRGPASSLYGNNAFLGMVNVVTREPGPRSLGGEFEANLGSGGLADFAGMVGGTRGATSWQASLSALDRPGAKTNFPELAPITLPANLDRETRQSAYLKVKGPDWSACGFIADRTQVLAIAPFYSVVGSPDNRYLNRLLIADARYTPTLVRVFGARNEFLSTFAYDGVRDPTTTGAYAEQDPNYSLGAELQARVRAGSSLLLTFGHEQTWQPYFFRPFAIP